MLILGVGPFVANFVCTWLGNEFALARNAAGAPTKFDFKPIFQVSLSAALVAALLLLLFFHPPVKNDPEEPAPPLSADDAWKKAEGETQPT